jgi:serine/threonine protein kinase
VSDLSAAESIFFAALARGTPQERAAYLDQACGHDSELRGCVERMLRAHPVVGDFLQAPAPGLATADEPALAERAGTTVGPYKLMEHIGEGGMGLVFVAEQQHPVRRRVALKIIKPGMDSRHVIARFEAERQALAMMDHQNIAKVYDAGTTESGRPYFVMELVHGVPITEYCDANKLTPRQRLELFVPVCHAIQHAHQKGIIHRDIKPSNVLVTMYDDRPVPKIIDFGVAKAVEQRLTERTVYTQFGTLVGTFEYMSPEQAEMNALGVDTRSDVYALGVLLYELLTGTTPLEQPRLREAALGEIVRLIKEEEPPRPSTRLSTSGALAKVAAARRTDPAKLSRLVRGELDWVVMRCLEKDRTRRYDTASALARDVERYLRDEPVEACPPSAAYRLRKAVRKHKKPLAVAALFAAVLVAALAVVTWKWQDERAARAEAVAARRDALDKAHKIEEDARRMIEANAALDLGWTVVRASQWAEGEAEFTRATQLRPDLTQVWLCRADLYGRVGLWDLAAADYDRAFKDREPGSILDMYRLALVHMEVGDAAEYRRICGWMLGRYQDTALSSQNRFFRDHLVRTGCLAPAAVTGCPPLLPLTENAIDPTGPYQWFTLYVRGLAQYRAGQFREAVRSLRASLEQTTYHARVMNIPVLAMALHGAGQADAARREVDTARKTLGQLVLAAFRSPAQFIPMEYWHDWLEYQVFYREAHRLIEGSPPPEDPRLYVIRGRAFAALRRQEQADAEFGRALRLAPDDPQIRSACRADRQGNRPD